ncbi:hypothetical protein PFISCL1PPCAC_4668, partial [Pristionchus fissidentatus]
IFVKVRSMDRILIVGCMVEKCIGSFASTTILTLAAPYITATYNTDDQSTFLSSLSLIAGLTSIVCVVVFMASKASKRINPAWVFIFSLSTFLLAYLHSFPAFDFYTTPIILRNDTSFPNGCDVKEYSWCEGGRIVNKWQWIGVSGVLIGIAVPLASIAFDTIYSKVLGKVDQNLMQGMIIVVVDCAIILVPIGATTCFKYYGPSVWWLIVVGVMAFGILLWIFLLPRLRKSTV